MPVRRRQDRGKPGMEPNECPIEDLDEIEGENEVTPRLLGARLKRTVSRRLGEGFKKKLKRYRNRLLRRMSGKPGGPRVASSTAAAGPGGALNPGDRVRVKSREEIEATLDARGRLKGLRFMPEMEPYCGTPQTVFKRLDRFFDEAKLTVRQSSGLVLLEGNFCQGVGKIGRCDRSCFYFWREEWLERIDDADGRE